MELALDADTQRIIDQTVRSGRYRTREEVVAAAVTAFVAGQTPGDFAPGEWDRLLAEGEASIEREGTLDGDAALAARRERRAARAEGRG